MANRMLVLQKIKNKNTVWFAIPLLGTHLKELKAVSKRYLYTHVHSNMIHNTQNVEATQAFNDEWMNMWFIHTIEYDSALIKEEIVDTCYNTDERRRTLC